MMGSGKTTLGRQLARSLGRPFVDCDQELEKRTGVTVAVIFDIEGEAGFRKRESHLIRELAERSGIVVATGGGAVLDAANRAIMSTLGLVIYLDVHPAYLWERARHGSRRPLLNVENPRQRLEELLKVRLPLYREIADIVIEGGNVQQSALLDLIKAELNRRQVYFD